MDRLPTWVRQALNLPIRFAQVREDPKIDAWVIDRLPTDATILIVGSGGCTLSFLSSLPNIRKIHVVDPNPAQLALCQVKLAMLRDYDPLERRKLLGHEDVDEAYRRKQLTKICDRVGVSLKIFGPLEYSCNKGLDYVGRYESVFRETSKLIAQFPVDMLELFHCGTTQRQVAWLQSHPNFLTELSTCFNQVMGLENLIALFGETATQNRVLLFSEHFFRQTVDALHHFDARNNPFLWQVLAVAEDNKPVPLWLELPCQSITADVSYVADLVQTYLAKTDIRYDYIHLSNVLDWLTVEEASSLLELTWNQLQPNGYTLIRQLNSNLPIRTLNDRFVWLEAESESLRRRDRSFFYRKIHCGQRR